MAIRRNYTIGHSTVAREIKLGTLLSPKVIRNFSPHTSSRPPKDSSYSDLEKRSLHANDDKFSLKAKQQRALAFLCMFNPNRWKLLALCANQRGSSAE